MNKAVITGIAVAGITLGALAYVSNRAANKLRAEASQSGAFRGYVTDLRCKQAVNEDCNRKCFASGEQPALLLEGSNEVLRLKNAEEVKKYPGARIEVQGTRSADVIVVSGVKALSRL